MRPQRCRESGYVLVLTVILLGLFLSLAAAAIDMGNIYVWQLRLDKAARAGALAGIGYRSQEGWTSIYGGAPYPAIPTSSGRTTLLQQAHDAVIDNFKLSFPNGISSSNVTTELAHLHPTTSGWTRTNNQQPAPDAYDPNRDKIDLYYEYDVPTFFAGRIAGVFGSFPMCPNSNGSRCPVRTHQTAQLDTANILLLLDVSGSMQDDIEKLKGGVTAFYQLFNPFRDKIAIIPFNLAANVAFNLSEFGPEQNTWTRFTGVINGLTATSSTNPCDALIQAKAQMGNITKPFIVLFSDGAPNSFRGAFSGLASGAAAGAQSNPTTLPNDWYQFSLEWVDPATTPANTYQGPAPLVQASGNPLFNFSPSNTNFANGNSYCGDIWSDPTMTSTNYFERALNFTLPAGAKRPGCLTNLDFTIPNSSAPSIQVPQAATGETEFHLPNGTQKSFELPYYCAIEAADQIRVSNQGTVYAIGLGSPQNKIANTAGCDDPLNDFTNPNTRKDNFLSRLAFAPATVDSSGWKPAFQFSPRASRQFSNCASNAARPVGYTLGGGINARTPANLGSTVGQYYPTENADDLKALFARVAKQILLRLQT